MSVIKTIKFLCSHPLSRKQKISTIIRFFKWQLVSSIFPFPVIFPFVENSRLIIKKGMTGATGNLYCGLHEFEDMSFLLHFLRENDLFVDIGANIGSYSILASSVCHAKSVSVEPVPSTFSCLLDNIRININSDKYEPLNIGIGSEVGEIMFTKTYDTANHVATFNDTNTVLVKINTLNNILKNKSPKLMKIDVEGFELEVLKGGREILLDQNLKAIIIELNGSGKRYGVNDQQIHDLLISYGFSTFKYNPFERDLTKLISFSTISNTLYIRDKDFVMNELNNSKKFKVLNTTF